MTVSMLTATLSVHGAVGIEERISAPSSPSFPNESVADSIGGAGKGCPAAYTLLVDLMFVPTHAFL